MNIETIEYDHTSQDLGEGDFIDYKFQHVMANFAHGADTWARLEKNTPDGLMTLYVASWRGNNMYLINTESRYEFATNFGDISLDFSGKVTGPFAKDLFETIDKKVELHESVNS